MERKSFISQDSIILMNYSLHVKLLLIRGLRDYGTFLFILENITDANVK